MLTALLIAGALAGCSDASPSCDPQALLTQPQSDDDMLAAEHLEMLGLVVGSTTHRLGALSDEDVSIYLGSSVEGMTCLILVHDTSSAGCSGTAAGLTVGDASYSVTLALGSDDDAPPSAAATELVPDGCVAIRQR